MPGSSTREGRLITRQIDNAILRGITRTTLIDLLKRENIELVERPFTVEEAKAAREAFITSATNIVMPVVRSTASRSATAPRACCRSGCGPNFIPRRKSAAP